MKKLLLAATSALIALALPGCLQNETTIHLNKDGSGTLVDETILGAQMLAMFDQMAAGFGGGGADKPKENPLQQMFSEDKAKKRAAELGEGVTYVKSESLDKNGAKGARVTYAFKDINKLKVSTGDGMQSMSKIGPMADAPAPAVKKQEPVIFTFADGKLTIKMPEPEKPAAVEAPAAEGFGKPDMDSPEAQAMMKQMMGDMKMSLKIVCDSGIAETNASNKDGDTITLFEMDMGKLMENPDTFKKLSQVDQKDPAAAMEAMKNLKGVKVEIQKEVTVSLK